MTRAKLLYGLMRRPRANRLQLGVRQFPRLPSVLAWDSDAADYHAEIRNQLLMLGQSIGERGLMTAAHLLSASAVLVTDNTRHYERIDAPLTLVNWIGTHDSAG